MTRVCATGLGAAAIALAVFSGITDDERGAASAATDPPLSTTGGAVAADHPIASRVGADVLSRGGNAVDAAVATALALGVVNPSSSGIGGGGFAVVYLADEEKLIAVNFREQAPAALDPDDFVEDGELDTSLSRSGGLAVGIPGEVAGLHHLATRYGRMSWRSAVAPAQQLAQGGFPVGSFLDRAAASAGSSIDGGTALHDWLHPGGERIEEGDTVYRRRLADALARISREGPDGFYRGPVAEDIARTVREGGGVMTVEDLAGYRAIETEPLVGRWNGKRLATMPLPSSGGLVILEALGILEATGHDLEELGPGSSAALHLQVEVLKHAFADRARFLGDDDPARLAGVEMLDEARLARLAERIDLEKTMAHETYGDQELGEAPKATVPDSGTSHLCVVDGDGNAVALTTTVNGYFGSKLMTGETGIVLNNEVDDFALQVGVPNMFGLVQSEHNLVGPGKRPLSSMSPTLVLDGDRVVGCLGGSGGPRIISNTFQVLLNHVVFDMTASEAVNAPRIHHQWLPNLILSEKMPADVIEGLRERGHTVMIRPWRAGPTAVQAIFVDQEGVRHAASDPRKGGAPAVAK